MFFNTHFNVFFLIYLKIIFKPFIYFLYTFFLLLPQNYIQAVIVIPN